MKEEMTRAQAKLALMRGHKIFHKYFMKSEFVQINSEKDLIDECGIVLNYADFWINRTSDMWDFGWFIVE